MAEDQNGMERTEDATPKRLAKAREEGQTARSRELVTVALVGTGALALMWWFPTGSAILMEHTRDLFRAAGSREAFTALTFQRTLSDSMWAAGLALAPVLLVLAVVSIGASGALGGFLFSVKAMSFKTNRISPIAGFKRIFSSQAIVELIKAVAKVLLISGVAIAILWQSLELLFSLSSQTVNHALIEGLQLVGLALLLFGVVLGVVAAIDVPFQIAQHRKQLKMTKQEVKDEMRDSEGKPEVKAAIRRAQQAMTNRRMLEDVPTADVVITNPEHFAIALRYESGTEAPIIIARGVDHMALQIRMVAKAHNVPQLRLPPLARAIFFHCEVGSAVPTELFGAVAQVLAYVHQLQAFRRGQQPDKPALGPIAVPRHLQRNAHGQEV